MPDTLPLGILVYELIYQVASDALFQRYLRAFFQEVSLTLLPVAGVHIPTYQEILIQRFSNPAIEDQVLRICKDGSAKIPGFILPTLTELLDQNQPISCISFVLACYMRFLTVIALSAADSSIKPIVDDPLSDKLLELSTQANGSARVFLSDSSLFGTLSTNEKLIEEVQKGYDSIVSVGITQALTDLVDSLSK
jgi:mannitol 2-dehydrogenase